MMRFLKKRLNSFDSEKITPLIKDCANLKLKAEHILAVAEELERSLGDKSDTGIKTTKKIEAEFKTQLVELVRHLHHDDERARQILKEIL